MSTITIRPATPDDAPRLVEIYAPYVTDTAITFEYEVPTVEDFRVRIEHTLQRYPYLVLEEDGIIRGYAYAGPFNPRAAYDWSCEMSIYLEMGQLRRGFGAMLYDELTRELKAMGILNLYACIGYPQTEDEYLTKNSAQFHEHMGFRLAGTFTQCGYKFGRWYDMIWMEKIIGTHGDEQPPVHFREG